MRRHDLTGDENVAGYQSIARNYYRLIQHRIETVSRSASGNERNRQFDSEKRPGRNDFSVLKWRLRTPSVTCRKSLVTDFTSVGVRILKGCDAALDCALRR